MSSAGFRSHLQVARWASSDVFPFHQDAFLGGAMTINHRGIKYVAKDSIVLPSKGKHAFFQLYFAQDSRGNPLVLLYGDEYGILSGIIDDGRLLITQSEDTFGCQQFYNEYKDLIGMVTNVISSNNRCIETNTVKRYIAIGATNSMGHNLLNDTPGLISLTQRAKALNLEYEFMIFRPGLFDGYIKNRLQDDIKPKTENSFDPSWYWEFDWSTSYLYCSRAFGYLQDGWQKLFSQATEQSYIKDTLWISIRSALEERHNPKQDKYIIDIATSLLKDTKITKIVFDGSTHIDHGTVEASSIIEKVKLEKNSSASILDQISIETHRPTGTIESYILAGETIETKLMYAQRVAYFVGPFGSGTWPTIFSDNPVSYLLITGDRKGLKTDPSFDYWTGCSGFKYAIEIN